jgi:tetratricopeptide (TPR) repeat protein
MMSFRLLRRSVLVLALLMAAGSPASAQEASTEETVAYQAWHVANSQNLQPQAIEAAKAYLAKFPAGHYAAFLKGWLVGPKLQAFNGAIQAKNTGEIIRTGREAMEADPQNLGISYNIAANLRRLELLTTPANFTHAAEAVEFSEAALKLIEAGKIIEGGKFDKDASTALLYQIQALVANNAKKTKEAIDLYTRSNNADPDNLGIVANNLLALASLFREPYGAAVQAYQAFPEADRQAAEPKPEVKAALDVVYSTADPLIDAWVRFVALARARNVAAETRDQVLASVKTVYSTRHSGDTSGLEPLIEKLQAEYTPKP